MRLAGVRGAGAMLGQELLAGSLVDVAADLSDAGHLDRAAC